MNSERLPRPLSAAAPLLLRALLAVPALLAARALLPALPPFALPDSASVLSRSPAELRAAMSELAREQERRLAAGRADGCRWTAATTATLRALADSLPPHPRSVGEKVAETVDLLLHPSRAAFAGAEKRALIEAAAAALNAECRTPAAVL